MKTSTLFISASLLTFGGLVAQASAQMAPGHQTAGAAAATQSGEHPEVQPDALPGTSVDKNRVTPNDKSIADMQPNDALFDAINRGDLRQARDAINRGADLGARNALGMTPLDLSVDLGRNDITFVLLSFKGMDDSTHRAPPRGALAAAPRGRHGGRAQPQNAEIEDDTGARVGVAARDPNAGRDATAIPTRAAAPRAPRQYATDGGTAVPSAGFLGFGK
jgi:hypothetical protein